MSQKGQITVPIDIRKELGLKPRDSVVFVMEDGRVRIESALGRLEACYASVPVIDPPRNWKGIEELAREDHARAVYGKMIRMADE